MEWARSALVKMAVRLSLFGVWGAVAPHVVFQDSGEARHLMLFPLFPQLQVSDYLFLICNNYMYVMVFQRIAVMVFQRTTASIMMVFQRIPTH